MKDESVAFGALLVVKLWKIAPPESFTKCCAVVNRAASFPYFSNILFLEVSTIAVEKVGDGNNTIETIWKFGKGIKGVTKCVLRCHYWLGHKQRHHREGS